jgi:plastocyanin
MGKWLGAAAVAAMVAAGGLGTGSASADDMNDMGGGGATCSPAGTVLMLTAQDHKFDKDCLAVPAGQPFSIRFDNKDNDRHNVAILPSHMATQTFFQGDIVAGPKAITYSVPALKAGTWHFHCEIHPNLMNGTFVVAAAPGAGPPAIPAPGPTPPPMSMNTPAGTPPAPGAAGAPTPKTAAAAPMPAVGAAGGDMPSPAPQATSAPAPKPAPAPPAAAKAAAANTAAAAGSGLPHTGPHSGRLLLLAAGLAFAAGGLSVAAGSRPVPRR